MASMRDLTSAAFRRIAVGDPEAVPAGVYAKAFLEREGLWTTLQPRLVPSSSVRAALAAVEAGGADAAIVYRTDARIALKATVAYVRPADRLSGRRRPRCRRGGGGEALPRFPAQRGGGAHLRALRFHAGQVGIRVHAVQMSERSTAGT